MPNHVTNILNIDDLGGMLLSDVRSSFVNEKGHVDFDKIVPMPDCLRGFEPDSEILGRAKSALGLVPNPANADMSNISGFSDRLQFSNRVRDICTPAAQADISGIIRCLKNYEECGYLFWYDWNIDHWGTKWGAYDQTDGTHFSYPMKFKFKTAWSHPDKVVTALSKKLPDVTFSIWYADEDIGSNCGRYCIKDGLRSQESIAPPYGDQSEEERKYWTETAFRIVEGPNADPAKHGYDENWEYCEEMLEESDVS